jgi:hypothetical protein
MKCPSCSFEGNHKEVYHHLLKKSDKADLALRLTDTLAEVEGLKLMLRRYGVFITKTILME